MSRIYCRKCGKRILTDRQPYKGIGKPKYVGSKGAEGDYTYKAYEHVDCNFKGKKIKVFTTKQIRALNQILKEEL